MRKPPPEVRSSGDGPELARKEEGGDLAREPAAAEQGSPRKEKPVPNPWAELDELGVICPPL